MSNIALGDVERQSEWSKKQALCGNEPSSIITGQDILFVLLVFRVVENTIK